MTAKYSLLAGAALAAVATGARGATPVLTRSYDDARTGANLSETVFTPHTVLHQGLKKLFSLELVGDDPRIEAQPLYVPAVTMSDGNVHDVLYVFSMANNVWAFDANTGAPIWPQPVSLGPAFQPRQGDIGGKINKSYGILSTPVIDADAGLIYLVNRLSDAATHQSRTLQLHALADGQAPVVATNSIRA
jgi:outer membrane protein assembly factor BamB